MVQILGRQQGAMHSTGKCWRYTKLCEPVDVSTNGFVVPMIGEHWCYWRVGKQKLPELRPEARCTSRAAILLRNVNCNTLLKIEKFGWFNFSTLGLQKR